MLRLNYLKQSPGLLFFIISLHEFTNPVCANNDPALLILTLSETISSDYHQDMKRHSDDSANLIGMTNTDQSLIDETVILTADYDIQIDDLTQAVNKNEKSPDVKLPTQESEQDVLAGSTAPGEPYIDQVLDELALKAPKFVIEEVEQPEGRRFLSTEYRLYEREINNKDSSFEHGAVVRWSRETIDYGTLSFDGQLKKQTGDLFPDDQNSFGEQLTLRQNDFALNNNWLMNNTIGDMRGTTNSMISSSYRFHLPSSLIRGADTLLYSEDAELQLTAGEIGNLQGIRTQSFESSGGSLWGLGYVQDFKENWIAGLQSWTVNADESIEDHTSIAALLQYKHPDKIDLYQLHSLVNDSGEWGLWLDGYNVLGRWRHHYGLFRFQPDLLWTDVSIANDRQGFYWRGDRISFRRNWSFGLEFEETNVEDDTNIAGQETTKAFSSVFWRLTRNTSVGGNLETILTRSGSGLGTNSSDEYSVRGFLNRRFQLGNARFQVERNEIHSGANPSESTEFIWDHQWNIPYLDQFNTSIGIEDINAAAGDAKRYSFGASYSHRFTPEVNLFGSISQIYSDQEMAGENNNTNIDLNLFWRPHRDWLINLSAIWSRNESDPEFVAGETVTDRSIFLSIQRIISEGVPATKYGARTGNKGTGRIIGRVFFDENRDGIWSPIEKVATGLAVYLDGRNTRQTDSEGRFEFWPVFTGKHAVYLAIEDVPLPWGMADDSSLKVQVYVREDTVINIPLIRLDR